ncbi:MAG TPA: CAP domain-containing protein [Marmoricola sp.]|jgi:uncharacterized protein YkwD|nr:CAP domain-containing protein [Marmoricola sp.]
MTRRTSSRSLPVTLLVGLTLTLGVVSTASASASASAAVHPAAHPSKHPARATTLTPTQFEVKVLSLINTRRKKIHCRALTASAALGKAARDHTRLMATDGDLSHQLPGELGLAQRIQRDGYKNWTYLAENVAWGGTTPNAVFQMWMHSAAHRANLQHCSLHNIGVGVVRGGGSTWVTADFGSRRH